MYGSPLRRHSHRTASASAADVCVLGNVPAETIMVELLWF